MKKKIVFIINMIISTSLIASEIDIIDNETVYAKQNSKMSHSLISPVSVITREDIEKIQPIDLIEILEQIPSLQIKKYGGTGSDQSIMLRGSANSQIQVFIDGQNISSWSSELQYINPDNIERIEVIRNSTLNNNGSCAIGGTIHIYTQKELTEQNNLHLGFGNLSTYQLSTTTTKKINDSSVQLGVNYFSTSGYNISNKDSQTGKFSQIDDDGYHNINLWSQIQHSFNNGIKSNTLFSYQRGQLYYDSKDEENPYIKFRNMRINNNYEYEVNSQWSSFLTLGYLNHKNNFSNHVFFKEQKLSATWNNKIIWKESHTAIGGLDYVLEHADSNKIQDQDHISQYHLGAFMQTQSQFNNRSDLMLGLRLDKPKNYNMHNSYSMIYGYNIVPDIKMTASFSTARRLPSLKDLYYPEDSNQNLKPESATNYEFSVKGNDAICDWHISLFFNSIDNLITWDKNKKYPVNIKDTTLKGVELTVSGDLLDWNLQTSYTFLNSKNNDISKDLPYRSDNNLSLSLSKKWNKFLFGLSALAQGKSYEDLENKKNIPGFIVFNFQSSYQFSQDMKLQLKILNLMNKNYYQIKGYKKQPRTILLNLNISF